MKSYKVNKVKLAVIHWSLRQLVKILTATHEQLSFAGNEKLGIEDFSYNAKYNEWSIVVRGEPREPKGKY